MSGGIGKLRCSVCHKGVAVVSLFIIADVEIHVTCEKCRPRWRPISEMHEDHGPCVVMDIEDPGRLEMGHVCDVERDWEEWATHFAPILPLTNEEADALLETHKSTKVATELIQ